MTGMPLTELGSQALARLGARVSGAYLVGALLGLLTGVRSGAWTAVLPAAGVVLAATVIVVLTLATDRIPWRLAAVAAGGVAVWGVCGAAGPLGWPRAQLVLGWVIPALGVGFSLSAGPWWGLGVFAVLGAVLAGLAGPVGSAQVPGTLVGAAVSVLAGMALHVAARRQFARAEAEIRAAESARQAHAQAQTRLRARRGLDRMLHDTVLSTLTLLAHRGVGLDQEKVRRACRRDLAALRSGTWGDAGQTHELEPSAPRNPGLPIGTAPLADRLEQVRRRAARDGLTVRVHVQAVAMPGDVLSQRTLEAWSGAVQECVANVVRHAQVAAADIVLGRTGDTLVTAIVDEGRGFDPCQVPAHRLGLAGSVHDRLREVGGRAQVRSRPGSGTVVELRVPITSGEAPV